MVLASTSDRQRGTEVPEKFVQVYRYSLERVRTIELVSDGYPALPEEASVEAYEALYAEIDRLDPTATNFTPGPRIKMTARCS